MNFLIYVLFPATDSISNINKIHNLSNNNSISFNSLILRNENDIEDINTEIKVGVKGVDEDVFQICIEFWH